VSLAHHVKPISFFHYCPRCGVKQEALPEGSVFHCAACDYMLYFNAPGGAVAFIERDDGRVLFIRRAREPAKGLLGLPGGFIEIGETAEEAVRREVREEVGLELTVATFLCSAPNSYHYREVTYPVLDIFFIASAAACENAVTSDEVTDLCWLKPGEVDPAGLAFGSIREAWRHWLARRNR